MDSSLPFAVHSGKGMYALLLGSGVSRAAGIRTGWEIIIDLIGKLAHIEGDNSDPNPESWFRNKYGTEPDYSNILDKLGRSPEDRYQLLNGYFEPTEVEIAAKIKTPTAAHHAIASLVAKGYFRVIVTTNFDRLIEQALETVGVSPTVVSSADGMKGMMPLVHNKCTVIKLHGDYRDPRLRNTPEELGTYEDCANKLLGQVLDEYGLIMCGWSCEWDTALCDAIRRCPTRRFRTYWAHKDALGNTAKKLAEDRKAILIQITDADSFFAELEAGVTALETYSPPPSKSKQLAVATLKRNIENDQRIVVHDSFVRAIRDLRAQVEGTDFLLANPSPTPEAVMDRLKRYENATELLGSQFASLCYWASAQHNDLMVRVLEQLGHYPKLATGYELWARLRLYPALLSLYAGGIVAMIAGRYDTLGVLFNVPKIRDERLDGPPPVLLRPNRVVNQDFLRGLKEYERHHTPASEHLFDVMKAWLRDYVLSEEAFDEIFDRFEYLFALRVAQSERVYLGRFAWKYWPDDRGDLMYNIGKEIETQGINWPPLRDGVHTGTPEKLLETKIALDQASAKMRW